MIMTKREVFTKAMEMFVEGSEEREVMEKAIKALDKKSSKPTKAQIENEGIRAEIKAWIYENPGHRVAEIAEATGYTPNKVNALVAQLRKANEVTRYYEKKVAYFKPYEEGEDE